MKLLAVCVLGGTIMVLARAAAPEAQAENNQTVSHQLVKRSSVSCPPTWHWIAGRWFRFVSNPMTWADAEINCQNISGNLASVHTVQDYKGIQDLIVSNTQQYTKTWIGGSDAQQNNIWLWSDGSGFYYKNWCRGEPNNYGGNEHCLQMNYAADKCWNDYGCLYKLPSVCVYKLKVGLI